MVRSSMSWWRGLAVLASGAWMLGATQAASAASGDEAAIRAQTVAWGKAYNAGDPVGVAAQYAEDALLLPPGAPAARGHAAILDFFEKDVAGAREAGIVFVLDPRTEVGISGSTGWESGSYQATLKGAVVDTGKFLSVSRKKNGKWLYIRDTWNSDAPPPPAAEVAVRDDSRSSSSARPMIATDL